MAYFHCLIGGGSSGGGYELTVTCDAAFAGTTITCTDGVTTLTQTCPSASPYEVVFEIPNGGDWTISGVISGQTVSTGVNIPTSAELIAIVLQTVTIHSAKEDTISYTDIDGATQTITFASGATSKQVQIAIEPSGNSFTFTSSVAKNPDNLSQDYSKTFTITTSTTDIYLMPDAVKTLYWWGYENNIEICSNTSGWTNNSAQPTVFSTVTKNTNSIALTAVTNQVSALGNPTPVSGNKTHAIGYITGNNVLAQISINPDKTARYGADHAVQVGTSLSYANLEYTFSNAYITPVGATGNNLYLSALWYE